jgi:hypothetical protein
MRASALRPSSSRPSAAKPIHGRGKPAARPSFGGAMDGNNPRSGGGGVAAARATAKGAAPAPTKASAGASSAGVSFDKWRSWSEDRVPAPKTTLSAGGLAITPVLGKAIAGVATSSAGAPPSRAPAAAAAKAAAPPPAPVGPPPPPGPDASLLADLGSLPVPDGMPALLRSVAQAQLQAWLDAPAGAGGGFSPDAARTEAQATQRTTTDISAAVELVAAVVPGDRYPDKQPRAALSLVACETERGVSWSRLEGLFAHWAVRGGGAGGAGAGAGAASSPWQAAPYGWRSAPPLSHDAGGGAAWQSAFERHAVSMADADAPTPVFGLLLEVPLAGPLAAAGSGVVFVLKSGDRATSDSAQATRWLREQPGGGGGSEARDFFVEVGKLPKLKSNK